MTGRSVWRAEGRSLAEKGWAPLRYWTMWFGGLAVAVCPVLRDSDADLDRPPSSRVARGVRGPPAPLAERPRALTAGLSAVSAGGGSEAAPRRRA